MAAPERSTISGEHAAVEDTIRIKEADHKKAAVGAYPLPLVAFASERRGDDTCRRLFSAVGACGVKRELAHKQVLERRMVGALYRPRGQSIKWRYKRAVLPRLDRSCRKG